MKIMLNMLLIVLLAVTSTEAALVLHQGAGRISPKLEPASDQKFFGKDYSFDKRAVVDKHYVFDHPYPAVQDSGDFDRDFVKDENSDGGRWDAQMDYDTLRAKIGAAKDELKELKKRMEKEYEDWMRAKTETGKYDDGLAEARKEVEVARKAAKAAAGRVNELEGRSQQDGTKTGGAVGRAIEDVQKEMNDLEKCKEALAKAKERLKELMKERAAAEKAEALAEKEKEKAEEEAKKLSEEDKKKSKEKEKEMAPKVKKDKEESKDKKNKKTVSDDGKDEDWKRKVEEEEEDTEKSRKTYLEELEDVRRTEKELEEAARTLRKFRRPPYVDENGGVYNVPSESPAMVASTPMAIVLMALTALFAAIA